MRFLGGFGVVGITAAGKLLDEPFVVVPADTGRAPQADESPGEAEEPGTPVVPATEPGPKIEPFTGFDRWPHALLG